MKTIIKKFIVVSLLVLSTGIAFANTITVTATPTRIPADGNAIIELKATVTNNEMPVPNVIVSWSKDPSTPLGTILDIESRTDSQGIAKSRLKAPINVGKTIVIATQESYTGNCTLEYIGPATIGCLDPAEKTMPAGGSKLCLAALFLLNDGSPVADGSVVQFSTSSSSAAITQTALTRNGYASAILTSPMGIGETTVTATCGNAMAESMISFVGTPAHVDVKFSKIALAAGGSSDCEVIAHVTDADGLPVIDGTTVNFTTSSGDNITLSGITQDGDARAILTAPMTAGIETVTATCGSAVGSSIIGITGAPAKLTISPDNQFIDIGGHKTRIVVFVADANGIPVDDNRTITLSTSAGTLDVTTLTTKNGMAEAILTSADDRGPATLIATDGSITGQTQVFFTGPAANIDISTSMDSIPNNGSSTCEVFGSVTDEDGRFVSDGTVVMLTTSAGTIVPKCSTFGGEFSAILRSDTSTSRATVQAISGSASNSTTVDFGGEPNSIEIAVVPSRVPGDASSYALVTATVLDGANHAVPDGTIVGFTTSRGVITAETTTDGGKAVARISSNSAGPATINVTACSVSSSYNYSFD